LFLIVWGDNQSLHYNFQFLREVWYNLTVSFRQIKIKPMSKRTGLFYVMALVITGLFFFMWGVLALPVEAQDDLGPDLISPAPNVSEQFASAQPVTESSFVEGVLPAGASNYFQIPLNAGYQLRVYGSATSEIMPSFLEISLYQESGNMLSTDSLEADGVNAVEAFYYKGLTAQDTKTSEAVYVEVKNKATGSGAGNIDYKVHFERIDRSDAFANTDAGFDFQTALDLQLENKTASFNKNFIGVNDCGTGKYCSTDAADFYMLPLMAGENLQFEVSPSAELAVAITVYDGDREKIKSVSSTGKGAITQLEYTSNKDQTIYLEITTPNFGSYAMSVAVATGGPTATPTPTSTPTEALISTQEEVMEITESGFNIWDYKLYLIIGGMVLLVIIIVVIVMLARKKKGPGASQQAEIDKIRQKLSGAKTMPASPASTRPGATRTMATDMKKTGLQSPSQVAPPPVAKAAPGFKPAATASRPPYKPASPAARPPVAPRPSAPPQFSRPSAPAGPPVAPQPPQPPQSTPTQSGATAPTAPQPPSPPPTSTPPKTGANNKPGAMDQKAQQDIDAIFG
jgi:hypothetical protein